MRKRLFVGTFLLLLAMLAVPVSASAGIFFSVQIAPPPLPVYDQPLCPGEGYIWTPGYWAYADDGFFWVPGTWVIIPEPGYLWTPGYWGWGDGVFVFHQGYWGPHVGFYGGVNYGFGYGGEGYGGGYWNNGAFFYNRSVNNVTNITNVYNRTVVVNNTTNNISYNGGNGGISARPTAQEQAAASERHLQPTSVQTQHVQSASSNRQLFESVNHGRPAIAATARPAQFTGDGVVAARAAAQSYRPPTARPAGSAHPGQAAPARAAEAAPARTNEPTAPHVNQPAPGHANQPEKAQANGAAHPASPAVHPKDLPPTPHMSPPNTGSAKVDQQHLKEQESLAAKQQQERNQLQQKQEQEHQQSAKQNASASAQQKLEQQHQQQTEKLSQAHAAQAQKLQATQAPPKPKPAPAQPKEPPRDRR